MDVIPSALSRILLVAQLKDSLTFMPRIIFRVNWEDIPAFAGTGFCENDAWRLHAIPRPFGEAPFSGRAPVP
jgi:hypothetical protein